MNRRTILRSALVVAPLTAAYLLVWPDPATIQTPAGHASPAPAPPCTTSSPGAIPGSGIVRGPDGVQRLVSFDEAWQVYLDGGPGVLVELCTEVVQP